MKLIETCIRRPVLSLVISLVLVLMGILAYQYLDTRYFPDFEAKRIYITTSYPGASAKLVEVNLTTPIESAISGVAGIDEVKSSSTRGNSQITIVLQDNANLDEVANKIRSAVYKEMTQLPDTIQTPDIQTGWNGAILAAVGFIDPNESMAQIRDYLNRFIINQIREVPGVAEIDLYGSAPYAMRIWLEPKRMAALNISVADIKNALNNSNIELPAGEVKSKELNYPVTVNTQLKTPEAFGNIVLKNVNGQVVRLHDVAKVNLGIDDEDLQVVRINGKPAISMEIYPNQDASPITVDQDLHAKLQSIQNSLPKGMQMVEYYNTAKFLKASVNEVYFSLAFAILCVALSIFIFLGSWRASLIPLATIPVCIITSFAIMRAFGFSINVITLLALVLAIGLVVDDAIVMLENIHRHLQEGLSPFQAALTGSRQITYAVIGMTISLAAVYAPIGLLSGLTATIFREFAFTLAGSVIISGFVALTLTPMMCSRLMTAGTLSTRYSQGVNRFFTRLQNWHQKLLAICFKMKTAIIALLILIVIVSYFVYRSLPSQFMPAEDMGFLDVVLNPPTGANIELIEHQSNQAYDIAKKLSSVEYASAQLSDAPGSFNRINLLLKPYDQRKQSAFEIAKTLNAEMEKVPGLGAFIFAPSPFSGSGHSDLDFMVNTSGSYKDLYQTLQTLKTKLKDYPGLDNIQTNMNYDSEQYEVNVNRDLAASLNVNIADIDQALAALLGGTNTTYFYLHGYRYNVRMQAPLKNLKDSHEIDQFYVQSATGQSIPLKNLVTIKAVTEQASLPHYNYLRASEVTAEINPGYSIGGVMKYLDQALPTILPKNAGYAYQGAAQRLLKSRQSMSMIFILGIVFIFLVLAALFESFIYPLVVLLVVPLTLSGALFGLKLFGGSLNVYTQIGLVTLIGLIAKHGILITQFANELREGGMSLMDATYKATRLRLRPILMTTTSMVFGALPLIFSTGAGANSRLQIGIVIICGLIVGTFFSLFVVPIAYSLLARLRRKP